MAREFVKWDYELRTFGQLETVVDRALAIAHAEPPGPVYLTLPREVLAERHEAFEYAERSRLQPTGALRPAPADVEEAARLLAGARYPIIVTKAVGRDPRAVAPLVRLAETLGAPVLQDLLYTYMNFPSEHPLHGGFDVAPHLEEADVILVAEADAPWYPQIKGPRPDARVIQVAADPLFSGYPIRGFPTDWALGGAPRLSLLALAEAAAPLMDARVAAERRARWEAAHRRRGEEWAARARAAAQTPMEMPWVSRCVGEHIDARTIVVNEYDLDSTQIRLDTPGTYFASSPAGGLGWGLGAALGAKLAAPEHTVICCVGDGAYIFGSPTAAHWVSRAYDLPVLYVIFNNRAWNAVKRSVQSYARDGWAERTGTMVLSDLDPAPDYEVVCRASGGHGERVEDPAALPDALARALRVVREERRQAVLNVICRKP
jgi:acetolactate synthase-1/2/3 large subunit